MLISIRDAEDVWGGWSGIYNCVTDDFVAEMNIPVKRKQQLLEKPSKKAALSPSKRFEKTISEEEVQKASKGCIPANTARSTG